MQAMDKLRAEMEQNKNNPFYQVVGNFLLGHLQQNPGAAEKILVDGKSIKGSLDAMQAEARKKQVNNCAVTGLIGKMQERL